MKKIRKMHWKQIQKPEQKKTPAKNDDWFHCFIVSVPQRTIRLNPKPYVSKFGASMFRKEPTLYSHTVYKQAGKVMTNDKWQIASDNLMLKSLASHKYEKR